MNVNSHKQITHFLLKAFSFKKEICVDGKKSSPYFAHYYDCKDGTIKDEKINILGTEKGYYDEDTENFLNACIEAPFASLKEKIRKLEKDKSILLSEKEYNDFKSIAVNFILFSLIRSEKTFKIISQHIQYDNMTEVTTPLQKALLASSDIIGTRFLEKINFKKLYLTFAHIDNSLNREFIIPRNCFYHLTYNNISNILSIPLTRKTCMMLVDKIHLDILNYFTIISEESHVDDFNDCAYINEILYNNDFLAGNEQELARFTDTNYWGKLIMGYHQRGGDISDLLKINEGSSFES